VAFQISATATYIGRLIRGRESIEQVGGIISVARAAEMAASTERDGRFRISTHADFAGEEVAPDDRAVEVCTHP
jgi:hypothetical protein